VNTTNTNPGGKSAAQIEGEVEETRASVSDTLNALRGKMEPSQIIDEVVDRISEYARGSGGVDFARNLGSAVRDNPLPVLLVGAGIGWLLLAKSTSGTPRGAYSEPVRFSGQADTWDQSRSRSDDMGQGHLSSTMDSVHDGATQIAGQVGDAASRAASYAKNAGSAVMGGVSDASAQAAEAIDSLGATTRAGLNSLGEGVDSIRHRASGIAQGATGRMDDLLEAQPMLTGVLGLTLGVALGALLPRTRAEDQLMGEARDSMVNQVGNIAKESYGELRTAVGSQVETVNAAAAETYSRAKEQLDTHGVAGAGKTLSEAADTMIETAGGAVSEVADQVNRKIEGTSTSPKNEGMPV